MTTNNTNTVPAALSMMEVLAAAKARKAGAASAKAAQLRKQLDQAVGSSSHSIPQLEVMRQEAREAMADAELEAFESELDNLIQVRKDMEKAESEAKRLQTVATTQGMEAHIDRKVKMEEAEKELKAKAKKAAADAAANKAVEEWIVRVLADLGDITEGQKHAVAAFIRGNLDWKYSPTEGGRRALLGAAGRAAWAFREGNKLKAKEAKAAKAAAAPLTHKVIK